MVCLYLNIEFDIQDNSVKEETENMKIPYKSSTKRNLLIGCSGSIAVIRLFEIIQKFINEFNISNYF